MPITYRAYRIPYEWVPQLARGSEISVTLPLSARIQIPNDQGELANTIPKLDTNLAAKIKYLTPVALPGAKDLVVPDAGLAGADDEETEEMPQAGMKLY